MDLSDGSDVEGDVDLDLDQYEENALLGSDDEESTRAIGNDGFGEYDDGHVQPEDGDVLELELNDEDGLEFGEDSSDLSGGRRLAPVQVRASACPSHPDNGNQNFRNTASNVKTEFDPEDEDEDDESGNTRSRFRSERNAQSMHQTVSSSSSVGNPIQTLGGRNVQTGGDMRQKQSWGNGRPHPQGNSGQRQYPRPQRFPQNRHPLLGDGPRPGNQRFQRPQGPRGNGPPVVQFQGQIFTDFNQPMRPPQPMQNLRPPPMGHQQGPPRANMQNRPGPRHMNQHNSMNGPPRHNNNNNPQFPRPNNNQQVQHRTPHPSTRPQRPPNQWRNQRPNQQRQQFPGMNNQVMQNGMPTPPPPVHPGPHNFPQDNRQPPFFEQGIRHDLNIGAFNHLLGSSVVQIQTIPQPPQFGGLISQPLRMQLGPPPQETQPPVQPVQPFFAAQQQPLPAYGQEPHHPQLQPQNFWPPPPSNTNGWPQSQPQHPQNFLGPPQNQPTNFGFQPPMEHHQLLQQQQQQIHFIETHHHQQQPPFVETQQQTRPGFEQPMVQSYFDQQGQQYHQYDAQESRTVNFEPTTGQSALHERPVVRREEYKDRSGYASPHQDHRADRVPSKRKYQIDDREQNQYHGASPEKRLNGRLGPPVKREEHIRDEKAEELMKIREESKKTMGLDDDYIKKLEDQKRIREQILKRKAAARRKGNNTDEELKLIDDISKSGTIYINPKAFKGDLSALNLNLKNIEMGVIKATTNNVRTKGYMTAGTRIGSSGKESVSVVGSGSKVEKPQKPPQKSKVILRIVKDKQGNVISRSKVKIVPKQQQDGPTSTKTT